MVKGGKVKTKAAPDFLADAGEAHRGEGAPSARVAAVVEPATPSALAPKKTKPAASQRVTTSPASAQRKRRPLHSMPVRIWADEFSEVGERLESIDRGERPSMSAVFRALVSLSLSDRKLWERAIKRAQDEPTNKGGRPPFDG